MGYTGRCTRGKLFGSPGLDGASFFFYYRPIPLTIPGTGTDFVHSEFFFFQVLPVMKPSLFPGPHVRRVNSWLPSVKMLTRHQGGQAEYVRVPLADGTVMKAPAEIDDKALILMADIFPTGFFGARNAFSSLGVQKPSEATAVVIGCGPVGLCAVVSALEYKPKHLFAVDSVDSRLELARSLGAEPLNFKTDPEGMAARIREVTDGRGADIVIEVVGLSPALKTAFDLLRPFGFISSIGVHNAEVRKRALLHFASHGKTLTLTWN